MRRLLCALGVTLLMAGCASVDTVKDAQGQGVKRTYRQSYDIVYQAALNAAIRHKLVFEEQDRTVGSIVLSSGVSWTSLGERIAVFVSRGGDRVTFVEIVFKPALSGITFPPNWPALLFGDIEQELAALKMPK